MSRSFSPEEYTQPPRDWLCKKCGNKLGKVVKVGTVRRLHLAGAQDTTIAIVTGAADVICPQCQTVRHWAISSDAMEELLRHRDIGP